MNAWNNAFLHDSQENAGYIIHCIFFVLYISYVLFFKKDIFSKIAPLARAGAESEAFETLANLFSIVSINPVQEVGWRLYR